MLTHLFLRIGDGGVTGYIALDNTNDVVVLSFRGSESLDNWINDLTIAQTSVSSLCSGCEAHEGFWDGWQSVKPTLLPYIQSTLSANPGYGLVLVGHSLGAALASLAATDLRASGMTLDTVSLLPFGAVMIYPSLGGEVLIAYHLVYLWLSSRRKPSSRRLYHCPVRRH
jgi:hypothetical protein